MESHAERGLVTDVRSELTQLLEIALAQHQQAATVACVRQVSPAAADAAEHFMHLDLPAGQVH